MSEVKIIHSDNKEHIEQITKALYAFEAEAGKHLQSRCDEWVNDKAPVGVFAFDGVKLVGGLTYHLENNWVFLHCGYVFEKYRHQGIYLALMENIESAARQKEFSGIYVSTYDFECPALYEKLSYVKGAVLHNCPKGNTSIDYYKDFSQEFNVTNRLQQENEQLRELVRLAVEDMKHCVVDTGCEVCLDGECEGFDDCDDNFVWHHADKLGKLGVEV